MSRISRAIRLARIMRQDRRMGFVERWLTAWRVSGR